MDNAAVLRIALITALSGVAMALALTWALNSHTPAPHRTLTAVQEKAYGEGFNLCRSRFIDGAHPQGNDQWNAVLRQFEVCTAQLGTPFKTTWEPEENKWRWEIVYPKQ